MFPVVALCSLILGDMEIYVTLWPISLTMKTEIYTRFDSRLRRLYREFAGAPGVSPFCSYGAVRSLWRHAAHTAWLRLRRPALMAAVESGKVLAMVPLIADISGKKHKMLGDTRGMACADAVFAPGISDDERRRAAAALAKSLCGHPLALQRLPSMSPLADALVAEGCSLKRETNCCRIVVSSGFNDWFKSLSRSVRQNIRTAFNRLERDGVEYELLVGNTPLLARMALDLYCSRQKETYLSGCRLKKSLKAWQIRHSNAVTSSLCSADEAIHVVLLAGGKVAACMSCLTNAATGGVYSVPRLAINTDFRFYSPGYVMIHEFLHRATASGRSVTLDLGRGLEKYKLDLAASIYRTSDFRH